MTPTAKAPNERPVPILMYHSVAETASRAFLKFAVPPAQFRQQLAWLADQRYTPITISQLVQAMDGQVTLPARPIALTFDDGFADFLTEVLPVLEKQQFSATLYMVTGCIGQSSHWLAADGEGDRPLLDWPQLRAIAASGAVEIGAHSHSHPTLDLLSPEQAEREISQSRQLLSEQLGGEVTSFCYPFGFYSRQVRNQVQAAGYTSACAVRYQMSSLADDRFALARFIVPRQMTIGEFEALLDGYPAPGNTAVDRRRSAVGKLARLGLGAVNHTLGKFRKPSASSA